MAPLDGYLKDPEYSNWVKSGLALNITNEVLRPFVVKEITKLHQSIVKKLSPGVSCGGCRVNNGCPNGICDKIQRQIEIQHWYPNPSFTNTSTERWSTEPWEIAKCYMPPSKGSRCSSDSDADFTSSINVIINCKHFQAFGTNDPNSTPESNLSKSRDFRNSIMHASPQKVSNHYMKENLDILINIINMVKAPETEAEVKEAIKGIEKIKTNQLVLKLEDVIEVRKNATEAIADKTEKQSEQVQRERMLVNFEAGCRKALCRLTEEHISKQEENLSVADFLSKIRIFAVVKDLCPSHKEMLFPRKGTQKDIREWDLFVYCFILEELDVSEPLEEAVCNFVRVVKTIRDKLLVDATAVTQNDLSELCEYLIDTDLNTEITHIFNKDSSNVDVIHSNNILVSWWREEEDYGNKQVSKKQLNNFKHIMEEMDKFRQEIRVMLRDREEHVTLQGANAAEIGAECELKVTGCDKKTEKALQKDITSPNINGGEKMKALNYFRDQRNLLEVNIVEGSIILKVTCSSTTNVLDFWDSCIDGRAVEALSKVRDYYRRYFKCDTLEFDVILTKKGVARCVDERVRGLSSQLEGLTHKVTDKVHDILESKDKEQGSGEDSSDEDEDTSWSDIDEDLITGSVENLTFGDEGGDDQASLAELKELTPKRETAERVQRITFDELEELRPKRKIAERIQKITFEERCYVDDDDHDGQDLMEKVEEIPAMSWNRRFQTKRKEEGINQKKQSKDDPVRYLVRQRRRHHRAQRYDSLWGGYIHFNDPLDMPSLGRSRRLFPRRGKTTKEKRMQENPLLRWFRRIFTRGEAGIPQEEQIKDKQLIPGSDTDSTGDEGDSGFSSKNPLLRLFRRIFTRGEAGIPQEEQIKDKQLIPWSDTDSTDAEGGSGILTNDPKRTYLFARKRRPSERRRHQLAPYTSIYGFPHSGRDIQRNPSEKDLISKPQRRVPTTSKTEFDKKPRLHETSHGFKNIEGEPETLTKLYTQPAKKPLY